MDFVNCPKCGKLFNRLSNVICDECIKSEEILFNQVKDYIDQKPNATVAEVSTEMKISVKKIMKYLREGRLEVSEGMSGTLKCETCGKAIKRGHYCDACVIGLNQTVTELYEHKQNIYKGTKIQQSQTLKHIK